MASIRHSPDLYSYLDQKYQVTIYNLAEAIFRDPAVFRANEAVKFIDSLYSRYYDMIEMPSEEFTEEFVHEMMVMYYDYLNQTLTRNPQVAKALLTSSFNKIIYKFNR